MFFFYKYCRKINKDFLFIFLFLFAQYIHFLIKGYLLYFDIIAPKEWGIGTVSPRCESSKLTKSASLITDFDLTSFLLNIIFFTISIPCLMIIFKP